VTSPARIKPLARAVAILPAPRNPMVKLEAMRGFYQEAAALSLPKFY
jgi:hypothetical protein